MNCSTYGNSSRRESQQIVDHCLIDAPR